MRWLLPVCAVLVLGGCGGRPAPPPPQAEPVRYHDGRSWVAARIPLDRLHVERGTAERITAREAYLLRTPARSLAELEEVARQMRAAQPDIRSLSLFIDEPSADGVRRGRLTRQVLVRGQPGVALRALVEARAARVVRPVAGREDTLLVEALSSDLVAAVTLAAALQGADGVVAAIPLSE